MHLVRALVFIVDSLEHFIPLASVRDELIFDFGLLIRLSLWFVVESAPATAMKATILTFF